MYSLFDWDPNQVDTAPSAAQTIRAVETPQAPAKFNPNRILGAGWKNRAKDNLIAIELVKTLRSENRAATHDERETLSRFIGFGASDLANNCFRKPGGVFKPGWEAIGEEIEACVSADELAGLAAATQYAHYTPELIAEAVWSGLERLGFRSGRILEPGCGTGLFIGLSPERVLESSFTGIERESISASIAAAIYPQAAIHNGDFIGLQLPSGYDLAIGNPPFSSRRVRGKALKEPSGKLGLLLHDYFIARSLELVRPGGMAAFVTSHGTLDKQSREAREYMGSLADLIAAVRLPAGAMRASAGTDVVVDVLFFHRRPENIEPNATEWTKTVEVSTYSGELVEINEYFAEHPENVLGKHAWVRGMYAPGYSCVALPGASLDDQLETFLDTLPENLAPIGEPEKPSFELFPSLGLATIGENLKEGSFGIDERENVFQVVNGLRQTIRIKSPTEKSGIFPKHAGIIRRFIAVRDAVRKVLRVQTTGALGSLEQSQLRSAYNKFIAEYGPINRTKTIDTVNKKGKARTITSQPNMKPFLADPDAWLVASIENYDAETDTAEPGAIFTKQIVRPTPERVISTTQDALAISLDVKGKVDLDYMAGLIAMDRTALIADLGDAIFPVPNADEWQTADEYLSGTVRTKLAEARAAAETDQAYERNVTALVAAQPKDLNPSEVTARLGSPWIPADDIERFVAEKLDFTVSIHHSPKMATWDLTASNARIGMSEWGTNRRGGDDILSDALNGRIPNIYDIEQNAAGNDVRVLNVVETEAAKEKLSKLKRAFEDWMWTDEERTNRLMKVYNELFNDVVPREFDGSHLRLPGASTVFDFYPHQRRAIWRGISAGNTYLAHTVGAGKTLCIAAIIKENKRLGLIRKAMLVVPGHCLAQASREFLQLYPTASILVADETNFTKDKRQQFMAQATLGDWDCIIITHSAFVFIPTPTNFEEGIINEEMSMLEDLLEENRGNRTTRKRIELRKEKNKQRLKDLESRKDNMVTIEEMGIDFLAVDEAQNFRKLTFMTNMDTLKGIDPSGSQRSWDLYIKSKYVETINPGRSLLLASGTPITNTMAELYTIQRYIDPHGLDRRGMLEFDAWANSFGDTRTELELQPGGRYKPVTRFCEFINVPELIGMFRMFADVLLKEQLRHLLKLPQIETGRRQIITAPASNAFKRYQKVLDERIDAIKERGGKPEKGQDILLSVITDGRHAAIDPRLVGYVIDEFDEAVSKLDMMVDEMITVYFETSDRIYYTHGKPDHRRGAGQMMFSDLGTLNLLEKRGFSAYAWARERFIAAGIPAYEIAIMQEYKKLTEKRTVVNEFNSGIKRIMMGSSQTMGTGINGQKRLYAIHHLDAPWLPSDIEQREGRGERQGNQNPTLRLVAYSTLGSMDSTMWQTLERKKRMIDLAMSGDRSVRRVEDAGSEVDQFSFAKAISTGNPRIIQKAGLEAEIGRLHRLRSAHFDDQHALRTNLFSKKAFVEENEDRLAMLQKALLQRIPTRGDAFAMTLDGTHYTNRQQAGTRLLILLESISGERLQKIGSVGGFPLLAMERRNWTGRKANLFLDFCGDRDQIEIPMEPTPNGIIARIENRVEALDDMIATIKHNIAYDQNSIRGYEQRQGRPFEFADELEAKESELREIEQELMIEDARIEAEKNEAKRAAEEAKRAADKEKADAQAAGASDSAIAADSVSASTGTDDAPTDEAESSDDDLADDGLDDDDLDDEEAA